MKYLALCLSNKDNVANTLDIEPVSKIYSSSDFLSALESEEKRLSREQQIDQKEKRAIHSDRSPQQASI